MDVVTALVRLNALASPDAIAQHLADIRCTGEPGFGQSCPIARYLAAETGELDVQVDPDQVTFLDEPADEDGLYPAVAMPFKVMGFIKRFDSGHYPELAEWPEA